MTSPRAAGYPVTVTQLPIVRCQVCRRTVAHQPGSASTVLTEHYQRAHADVLAGLTDRPA